MHPQEASPLCNLPPEILLLTGEALPLPSQTCLTMTCKKMTNILGNESWLALRSKAKRDDDRKQYLQLMSQEHPSLLPCFYCMDLHRRETLLKYNACSRGAGCTDVFRTKRPFHYAHVQLVMRAHHISPRHGLSLDQLPSPFDAWTLHRREPGQLGIQTSSVFKIVGGRLLLKLEVKSKVDVLQEFGGLWGYRSTTKSDGATSSRRLPPAIQCVHSRNLGIQYDQFLETFMMKTYVLIRTSPASESHIKLSDLRRCVYCATEVNFSIDVSKESSSILAITCWRDLGSGMDPTDPAWISHCDSYDGSFGVSEYKPDANSPQSIKERFEGPVVASRNSTKPHLSVELLPPQGFLDFDMQAFADLRRVCINQANQ
ncbi:hypothetical protein MMC30_004858 [Trapelia coarctata]|nr:hypothetical protein [Trapelia coarctata]